MFEFKIGEKVIAMALCSYWNCANESSGPTIEMIETAEEWQGHGFGFGKTLLKGMESYFENTFDDIYVLHISRVNFNVCYVTSSAAFEWFIEQGFDDWDGMGEEMGKHFHLEYTQRLIPSAFH